MTEVHLENLNFESIESILQGIEYEIIRGTSAGFGLTVPEKEKVYEDIRNGFRNYADVLIRNVRVDTAQYVRGQVRGDSEGHSSPYIIAESKTDAQVSLFLCYKTGADSLGTVRNLELGGFDGQCTEETKKRLCGRRLFDESFNHILATSGEPTLKIYRPDLPSAISVKDIYDLLIRRTRQPLLQRIVTYFR